MTDEERALRRILSIAERHTDSAVTRRLEDFREAIEVAKEAVGGTVEQSKPAPTSFHIPMTHEAVERFWSVWNENGKTGKHGTYESTWMAFRFAAE